jgi:hypothetical protein
MFCGILKHTFVQFVDNVLLLITLLRAVRTDEIRKARSKCGGLSGHAKGNYIYGAVPLQRELFLGLSLILLDSSGFFYDIHQ